jgi:saccharopine dehydrogenase-like NADP-dependent oxidoreductase
VRGTLRYQGFPAFIKALVELGFLKEDPVEYLATSDKDKAMPWNEVTARAIGAEGSDEA